MKQPDHIQKQVEETLASLDGISRAKANPFLYTRIHASLTAEESGFWARLAAVMTKPVVAIATVVVILLMNSVIFFNNSQSSNARTSVASQDEDQLLSREYAVSSLSEETIYTLNEEQP